MARLNTGQNGPRFHRKDPLMKSLLVLVLIAAIAVNVSTSFAFDGALQIIVSVGTGVIAIGSAAGLFLLRNKAS